MTRYAPFAVLTFSFAIACTPRPPISTRDGAMSTEPVRTFTITLPAENVLVARGERSTIDVHVQRFGGFDEPVLIELVGLPDPGCVSQARESRVGEPLTTLTIVAARDDDGNLPPIERAPFVVQASTLEGLRQIAPAHVSVR